MADLRGTSGSVTYGGAEVSGGTLIEADIVQWTLSISRDRTRVTRPGYVMHRYSYGPVQAEGTLRVVVTDGQASMAIPVGVSATLVLFEKTAATSRKYTLKATMYGLVKLGVDSANGSQQWAEYRFTADATANTDTIAPT